MTGCGMLPVTLDSTFGYGALLQVTEQMAGRAAELAVDCWHSGEAECSLGAVQLTCLLGFPGVSSLQNA